jgi:uncharacterized protein YjiS (DUF1127 family)
MLLRMIRALSHRVFPKLRRYTCFSTISRQRQQEAQLRAMNDLELRDLGIGAARYRPYCKATCRSVLRIVGGIGLRSDRMLDTDAEQSGSLGLEQP